MNGTKSLKKDKERVKEFYVQMRDGYDAVLDYAIGTVSYRPTEKGKAEDAKNTKST